jgi:hypothetical protein
MRREERDTMTEIKPKRSIGIFGVAAWIAINILFMVLELTALNDSADLNNSVLLILWLSSIVALFSMKKWGAAIATFVFIYAFSFNAFNIIYFPDTSLLNGVSAIFNFIAISYMFRAIFAKKFS